MSSQPPLTLALPGNQLYKELIVVERGDPRTWKLVDSVGRDASLDDRGHAGCFFPDLANANQVPLELIYVSIAQDEAGRHSFLCFEDVRKALEPPYAKPLEVVNESTVKSLREREGAILLYARPPSATLGEGADAGKVTSNLVNGIAGRHQSDPMLSDKELCPKVSPWTNYHVIPEVSLGLTQKLILCDEATLIRSLPEERIFEYLTLIVNCHENEARVKPGFYKVGACSTDRHPRLICREVHKWYNMSDGDKNRLNDQIQEAIWAHLQSGTVAVHCLAGIHRAACIVACHFLWRHYVRGEQHIPSDLHAIYAILKAHRPHVEMAYQQVLHAYKRHLMDRTAQA